MPLQSLDDHLVVAYQQRRFDSAEKQGELVSQAGARRFSETSLQILLCSSENRGASFDQLQQVVRRVTSPALGRSYVWHPGLQDAWDLSRVRRPGVGSERGRPRPGPAERPPSREHRHVCGVALADHCPGSDEMVGHRAGDDHRVGLLAGEELPQVAGEHVGAEEGGPEPVEEEIGDHGPACQGVRVALS